MTVISRNITKHFITGYIIYGVKLVNTLKIFLHAFRYLSRLETYDVNVELIRFVNRKTDACVIFCVKEPPLFNRYTLNEKRIRLGKFFFTKSFR